LVWWRFRIVCSRGYYGGVLFLQLNSGSEVVSVNLCEFKQSRAVKGGAIYLNNT
jgi:hypothetical protein